MAFEEKPKGGEGSLTERSGPGRGNGSAGPCGSLPGALWEPKGEPEGDKAKEVRGAGKSLRALWVIVRTLLYILSERILSRSMV